MRIRTTDQLWLHLRLDEQAFGGRVLRGGTGSVGTFALSVSRAFPKLRGFFLSFHTPIPWLRALRACRLRHSRGCLLFPSNCARDKCRCLPCINTCTTYLWPGLLSPIARFRTWTTPGHPDIGTPPIDSFISRHLFLRFLCTVLDTYCTWVATRTVCLRSRLRIVFQGPADTIDSYKT